MQTTRELAINKSTGKSEEFFRHEFFSGRNIEEKMENRFKVLEKGGATLVARDHGYEAIEKRLLEAKANPEKMKELVLSGLEVLYPLDASKRYDKLYNAGYGWKAIIEKMKSEGF